MAGDAPIGEAKVRIRPDAAGFAAEAQTQIVPAVRDIKKTLLGLTGAGVAISIFKGGIDELKEQQAVVAQTGAVLKSTGEAAGVSAEHLRSMAESMQDLTGKDAEAIQAGENLLLTFRSIKNEAGQGNDIFDQSVKIATDLSVAWGTDMKSASIQIGKALEDPIRGLTALRRVGVQFTEQQQEQIKTLMKSGQHLEAQKVVLAELEKQVGGSAEAYGNTLAGKMERAKNVMDDFKASVVQGMAPALEAGAALAEKLGQGFASLPEPVRTTVVALAGLVAVMKLGGVVVNTVRTGVSALAAGFDKAAVGAYNLSGNLGQVAAKGGIAAAALAGVAIYAKQYADASAEAVEAGQKLHDMALPKGMESYDAAGRQIDVLHQQADALAQNVDQLNYLQRVFGGGEYNDLVNYRNGLVSASNELTVMRDQADALAQATGKSKDETFAWLAQQKQAGTVYKNNTEALAAYTGKVGEQASAAEDAATAQKRLNDEIAAAGDRAKYAKTQVDQLTLATMDLVGQHLSQRAAQREIVKAQEHLNEVYRDPKASASDRAEAEDQLVAALDRKAKADADAAEQTAKSFGVQDTAKVKADAYKTSLEGLAGKFPILNQYVDELKTKLDALPAEKDITIRIKTEQQKATKAVDDTMKALTSGPTEQQKQDALAQIGAGYPGHAAGGPVSAGVPTVVGEAGKELFIPATNGTIVPNHAMGGGGGPTIVQNIYGWNEHPDQIRRDVLAGVNIGLTGRQAA